MLRTAGNTVSPISDVECRVAIRVCRESTVQTPEHRLMPESAIPFPTSGAGERSVSRANKRHRHTDQWGQQENALREEFCTPLPVLGQRSGILKRNTSAGLISTAYQGSGFFGLRLSRSSQRINLSIMQMPLLIRRSLLLFVEYGPQVRSTITIRTGNGASDSNIYADPSVYRLHIGQRNFDAYSHVPFPILAKDFALFAECSTWKSDRSVHRAMFLGWNVELADTLDHHPQVKAFCFAWGLHVGCVDQFGSERGSSEGFPCFTRRLQAPVIVNIGASGRPSNKLPLALAGRESGFLRSRNGSCGVRERLTKEARQESQHVGLGSSRKQLEFVPENNLRRHILPIAQTIRPRNPMRRWVSMPLCPENTPLCCAAALLQKCAPSSYTHFKGKAS